MEVIIRDRASGRKIPGLANTIINGRTLTHPKHVETPGMDTLMNEADKSGKRLVRQPASVRVPQLAKRAVESIVSNYNSLINWEVVSPSHLRDL